MQVRRLAEWLTARGETVVVLHAPGSTPVGERVREILLHAKEIPLAENTQALLNHGCELLLGYTTRPCCVAGAEMANKAQVPFVGPFSGTPALYKSDGTTFTVRASYDDELAAIVDHLAPLGYDDIAFVYLNDAAKVNLPLMEKNLARHQLKLRTAIGVDRNSRETTRQAQALVARRPKAIVALANNLPLTELGQQQVQGIIEQLRREAFDVIYASPTEPAASTAEMIGDALGIPVRVMIGDVP